MDKATRLAIAKAEQQIWNDVCVLLDNLTKGKALKSFERELDRADAKVKAIEAETE